MKAVWIREFGDADVLEIREVPDPPAPSGRQVLISIKAAGLNRADLLQRKGLYPPPAGVSANIPGLEFSGEVIDIGSGVTRVKPSDRVFGIASGETQAEMLLSDEGLVAKIPENLTYTDAAAVPEAFITANDAVFTQAGLTAVEVLLVHAVGSGVGLAALQLAKAAQASVYGTSRTAEKLERCRRLGLDEGIVPDNDAGFSERVLELSGGRGVDCILDLVGGRYFGENLKSLALRGRMMLVGLTAGSKAEIDLGLVLRKRAKLIGTVLRSRALEEKAAVTEQFAQSVVPLLANGTVQPNVDRVFAMADVAAAHRYLSSNESFGKVVLEIQS